MNFLVQHALDKVWAEPVQDKQEWLEATRLTDVYGGVGGFTVYQRYFRFPVVAGVRYFHFYHLGSFPEIILGIGDLTREWVKLSDVITGQRVLVQAVLASGLSVPIERCWIKKGMDRGIYLAVEHRKIDSFGTIRRIDSVTGELSYAARRISDEKLYLRFYSNAVTQNPGWRLNKPNVNQPYTVHAKYIAGIGDYLAFLDEVTAIKAAYGGLGLGYYVKGGYLVNAPGAFVEEYTGYVWTYTHDLTMENMVERTLPEMGVFPSEVDAGLVKYLVWEHPNADQIDYHDDIDFVLFYEPLQKGVLLPRYAKKTVRQVTHNSYSIPVSVVASLRQMHQFVSADGFRLRMYIRRGGMVNGLVYQGDRLSELFSLPVDVAKSMLVGSESNIPFWRAPYLEGSDFIKVVSGKVEEITATLVESAYGYHAINKIAYKPYQDLSMQSGTRTVHLGPGNATTSPQTLYSYDVDGLFIGREAIVLNGVEINDMEFVAPDQTAYAVELLVGQEINAATDQEPIYRGDSFTRVGLREQHFRAYAKFVGDDRIHDVTGQSHYVVSGDMLQWSPTAIANAEYKAVRFSGFIATMQKTFDIGSYTGTIDLSFPEYPIDGIQSVAAFGFGNLDIFMDGELLIENVDYYVTWPRIVVVRRPSTSPEFTNVLVRAYGFPDKDTLLHRPPREQGFVHGGLLSVNDVFDLRKDRNIRLIIDGRIVNAEGRAYAEEMNGNPVLDGRPYSISDYRQDVDSICSNDTLSLREIADSRDIVVSDVLKQHLPMRNPSNGFVVGNRWQVVSPVVSRLLHAFVTEDYLGQGQGESPFGNVEVEGWIAPYADLFEFDPTVRGADPYYVNILPHQYNSPMSITPGQRNILAYVIRHYLRDLVDISAAVTLS
jgi:hypothetical protein